MGRGTGVACETATAPPALMLRYVEELTRVSQVLLNHMEEDPSAWGVAAAFLTVEQRLESAFVGWCGVVGGWFEAGDGGTPKRKRFRVAFAAQGEERGREHGGVVRVASVNGRSSFKDSVASWRISVPSIPSLNNIAITSPVSPSTFLSRRRERDKTRDRPPLSPSAAASGKPKRRLSVRDLAILPTQRIMRYVLLYRGGGFRFLLTGDDGLLGWILKDLLDFTPSISPSRALVERAVEAACRIAQKCDRAQGNAAFLQKT